MRPTLRKHNIRFRVRLGATKVIAVLQADDASYFPDVAQVLHDSGIPVLEIAIGTPGAFDAITTMRAELGPETMIGAGGARTLSDVDACARARVSFLSTPTLTPAVLGRAQYYGLPVVCGALTPTEIDSAWRAGAAAVNVFPIGPTGGVGYLHAVRSPLPEIPLVPAGGVSLHDIDAYLGAGAFAVSVGASLLGDSVCGGRMDALGQRATDLAALAGKFV